MSIEVIRIPVHATEDVNLVRISGVLDQVAAGPLSETLVDLLSEGRRRLIIDMSRVDLLTRAAARCLVVAAKLAQAPHGTMRICGARAGVAAMLDGLGHPNLLKRDPDLRASLEVLSGGAWHPVPHTVPIPPALPANTNLASLANGTHGVLK